MTGLCEQKRVALPVFHCSLVQSIHDQPSHGAARSNSIWFACWSGLWSPGVLDAFKTARRHPSNLVSPMNLLGRAWFPGWFRDYASISLSPLRPLPTKRPSSLLRDRVGPSKSILGHPVSLAECTHRYPRNPPCTRRVPVDTRKH